MGLRNTLLALVIGLAVERPARRTSLAALADTLEEGGRAIERRLAGLACSPANIEQLRHIIGIERWGQRRLRVALGEPALHDEYDEYRPAATTSWDELRAAFQTTRQQTVELARTLATRDRQQLPLVAHNQFGPLSIPGWLRYLTVHANRESKRLK